LLQGVTWLLHDVIGLPYFAIGLDLWALWEYKRLSKGGKGYMNVYGGCNRPFPRLAPLKGPYCTKINAQCPSMTQKCTFSGRVLRAMWGEEKEVDNGRRNVEWIYQPYKPLGK